MMRGFLYFTMFLSLPMTSFAAAGGSSVTVDLNQDCSISSPGPSQIKTCKGPAGYQAVIHQTPMGEQLTLENTGAEFSAAVIRCKTGQKLTKLTWRMSAGKAFAALIGYRCAVSARGQSAQGAAPRILAQGLQGFEEYGHEVMSKAGNPTMKAAEQLADGWLKKK